MAKKAATKRPSTRRTATATPRTGTAKRAGSRPGKAGKAEGDAPVRAYIDSLQGWKREVAKRFDDLIQREVPNVRRAVKWSVPFYGVPGQGWFASFGAFAKHVKLNFFRGTLLKPPPPNGTSEQMRGLDLTETDAFDDKLVASWIRQASKLRGWGSS